MKHDTVLFLVLKWSRGMRYKIIYDFITKAYSLTILSLLPCAGRSKAEFILLLEWVCTLNSMITLKHFELYSLLNYLWNRIPSMDFGNNFMCWFKLLKTAPKSSYNKPGYLCTIFSLQGTCQGCHLYALLFPLVMEPW